MARFGFIRSVGGALRLHFLIDHQRFQRTSPDGQTRQDNFIPEGVLWQLREFGIVNRELESGYYRDQSSRVMEVGWHIESRAEFW